MGVIILSTYLRLRRRKPRSLSQNVNSTFAEPTAPKVRNQELVPGLLRDCYVLLYDCFILHMPNLVPPDSPLNLPPTVKQYHSQTVKQYPTVKHYPYYLCCCDYPYCLCCCCVRLESMTKSTLSRTSTCNAPMMLAHTCITTHN